MAAIIEDIFGQSNRRRCVRGRPAYIEPSDNLFQQEDKAADDNFSNSEGYSQYDTTENIEVDDVEEEEAVTIDLSDFLSADPLIAEPPIENAVDSGALSESHSQFRVTSSHNDSSQILLKDLTFQKETNLLDSTTIADSTAITDSTTITDSATITDSTSITDSANITDSTAITASVIAGTSIPEPHPVIVENGIDKCITTLHSEMPIENVSFKENIVNGVKHFPDKYLKPKLSGPLKNSKNISRIKNFNKNNIEVFGKYPMVQCERLDIDNFVKETNIKVGNWPLQPANSRKPKANRNINSNKKASPVIIRPSPKLFNRTINVNHRNGTLNKARSILVDSLESRMAKSGNFQQPILQNLNKTSFVSGETLIKLMHQNVTDARLSNKLNVQKFPIITSVNKLAMSPKTYQLISPKTKISPKSEKNKNNFVTPILPKPTAETVISPMILKDFTVIQPYVEDPTSPIKPKPIATVPLDIVPTIETISHTIIDTSPIKSPLKSIKPAQSVFLNGVIQQISFPKKVGNKSSTHKGTKAIKSVNTTGSLVKVPISPTSVVVDAMQSVFNKSPTKKVKAKQNVNKNANPIQPQVSVGCNAYNSTLNELLFGFDDFDDESFNLNDSIDIPSEPCGSSVSTTIPDSANDYSIEYEDKLEVEKDLKNVSCKENIPKDKFKRKKKTVQSLHDSDTWSASEGENDTSQVGISRTARRKQRKLSNTSRRGRRPSNTNLKSMNTVMTQDSDSSPDKAFRSPVRTKCLSHQESNVEHSEDGLLSEKAPEISGHIFDAINLDYQELEKEVLGNSESSNLKFRTPESTSGVSEALGVSNDKPKSKRELNQNGAKKSPTKLLIKSVKEKSKIRNSRSKKLEFQPKFQPKVKKNSVKLTASARKKLSRPADIIKEINTITGASLSPVKSKKGKSVVTKKIDSENNNESDSGNETKNMSLKQKKGLRSKMKKNKPLQVLFKRPARKRNSQSLSAQEDASNLSDDMDEASSLSENSFNSTIDVEKREDLEATIENKVLETKVFVGKREDLEITTENNVLETKVSDNELKSEDVVEKQVNSNENVCDTIALVKHATSIEISDDLSTKEISVEDTVAKTYLNEKIESDVSSEDKLETPPNNKNSTEDLSNQAEVENTSVEKIDSVVPTETSASSVSPEVPVVNISSETPHISEMKEASECTVNEINGNGSVSDLSSDKIFCLENMAMLESADGSESQISPEKAIVKSSDINNISNEHSEQSLPLLENSTSKTNLDSKLETNLTSDLINELNSTEISKAAEISPASESNATPEVLKKPEVRKRGRPRKISKESNVDCTVLEKVKESLSLSELDTSEDIKKLEGKRTCRNRRTLSRASESIDVSTSPAMVEQSLLVSQFKTPSEDIKKSEGNKSCRKRSLSSSSVGKDSSSENMAVSTASPEKADQRLPLSEFKSPSESKRTRKNKKNLETKAERENSSLDSTKTDVSESHTSLSSESVLSNASTIAEQSLSVLKSETPSKSKRTRANKKNLATSPERKNGSLDSTKTDVSKSCTSLSSESITSTISKPSLSVLEFETPSKSKRTRANKKNLATSPERKNSNLDSTKTDVSKSCTSLSSESMVSNSTISEQSLSALEFNTPSQNIQILKGKRSLRNKRNLSTSPEKKDSSIASSNTEVDVPKTHVSFSSESNPEQKNSPSLEVEATSKSKKKCPKIKISVAKSVPASNSQRNLRNWYVSERKASTDSIPSDEITVLKPTKRANSNRVKGVALQNVPVVVKSLDSERKFESTTFVTNAIVHVDATDITDDDILIPSPCEVETGLAAAKSSPIHRNIPGLSINIAYSHSKNQSIVSDIIQSMISTIENDYKVETSRLSAGSDLHFDNSCYDPKKKIKLEPIDDDTIPEVIPMVPEVIPMVPEVIPMVAKVKEEDSISSQDTPCSLKLTGKRKSMPASKKGIKFGRSPVSLMAEAINSSSKSKATKKILPKVSTPQKTEVSQPPNTAQSAPTRMSSKKFTYENVTLPFTLGWMRELVHRGTEAKPGKKMSDVYYFSPEGKKLRSMVEISNYLSTHPESKLTLDNFTYCKELVYREPFEIERSAKQKSIYANIKKEVLEVENSKKPTPTSTPKITKFLSKPKTTPAPLPKTSTPKIKITLNKKSNAQTNEKDTSLSKSVAKVGESDKANASTSFSGRQRKRKVPFDNSHEETPSSKKTQMSAKGLSLSLNVSTSDHVNEKSKELPAQKKTNGKVLHSRLVHTTKIITPPVKVHSSHRNTKLKQDFMQSVDYHPKPPCSSRCPVPRYQLPSIQCAICLCFFHPQCVQAKTLKFACMTCTMARLAYYESTRNPTSISSSTDATEDENVDIPDKVDVSLLFPDISLHVPTPIPQNLKLNTPRMMYNTASNRFITPHSFTTNVRGNVATYASSSPISSSSCTSELFTHLLQTNVIPMSSTIPLTTPHPFATNVDNVATSASSSPSATPSSPFTTTEIFSHLLQSNVIPMSTTIMPIVPSKELLNAKNHFGLPSCVTNSPNTRVYRVRLPTGSPRLPNSIVVRRLPDRSLMLCSMDALLGQCNASVRPQLNVSPVSVSNVQTPTMIATNKLLQSKIISDAKESPVEIMDDQNSLMSESVLPSSLTSEVPVDMTDPTSVQAIRRSVECLSLIFKSLNVRDLLSASQVSRSWRHLCQKPFLWEKVSFHGLIVTDWQRCCQYLQQRGTKQLDLYGIEHPKMCKPWENLENNITSLSNIESLIINQLPPSLLKAIISNMPQLRSLECHFVTTDCKKPDIWESTCEIELEPFRCLGRLQKLKIGSGGGIVLGSGSNFKMPYLPNLYHVALTGFDFHSHVNLEFLSQLSGLMSLELGNMSSIEPGIYPLLGTLTKLKSLRLENGGNLDEVKFSEALSKMKRLEILELMNFKISAQLSQCFKNMEQLIHVSIWPDTTTKGAVVNHNLLTAVSNVRDLKYFCWGTIHDGDEPPETLELREENSSEDETDELNFEDLFATLDNMFPECRVDLKCVARKSWKEFCSTRK